MTPRLALLMRCARLSTLTPGMGTHGPDMIGTPAPAVSRMWISNVELSAHMPV